MFNPFKAKENRIYLDHAGATPVSLCAQKALLETLITYGNPSGIHKEGVEAGLLLDKARALCANVLNVHAYEIYFTGTGTESCNLAILGTYLSRAVNDEQKTNDSLPHIITSIIEHPAVLEPIRHLEKRGQVRVTYLPVYEDGIVKVQDIRQALTEETILVSVMYANNEIGTIQPVKEIGRMIDEWKRDHGLTFTSYPYFHIDACQAGNYLNLDALRLKCHLMTVNSSKVYGPKGIALLYKREGIALEPITLGGGQERELRSGTESAALAHSFAVALSEAATMREEESSRERMLRDYLRSELIGNVPDVVMYGAWDTYSAINNQQVVKNELRLPNNINCRVPGISSEEMILRLDAKGFSVSHKSACASQESDGSYVIEALGSTQEEALENIRITLGRSTEKKDIERLVRTMQEIAGKYVK